MAGISNHDQATVWHGLMQFPGAARWTNHIVSTLDNHGGQVLNEVHMVEDVGLFNENGVDEVMAFNASKGDGEIQVLGLIQVFRVGK